MKLLRYLVLMVVAAALGLAVGHVMRGRSGPVTTQRALEEAGPTMKGAGAGKLHARVPPRDDSPLATQLEKDLSISAGVTRWLYWLEALEKASPLDFPRLALRAKDNPAALRLITARWAEIAPRHLLDTLIADSKGVPRLPPWELQRALFDTWIKRDPEAVIAALNEPGDYGARKEWRTEVATAMLRVDVERALRLFTEWNISSYDPGMSAISKWAASNPRHAAEFVLRNSVDYVSQRAAETIGNEWGKADPAGALAFAAANPGDLGSRLGNAALQEWTKSDLAQAAQWLSGTDPRTRNRLGAAFVESWAQKDAGSALAWCQENLVGSSLVSAVGGVLRGAATKDVAGAAALVAGMEASPGRAEAAAAVARKWFPEFSSGKPAQPEAVAWLSSLDSDSIKRVLSEVDWHWATSDARSMSAFLAAASPAQVPEEAYSVLARQMVRQNPTATLDWASQLPGEGARVAGRVAFAEWRTSQPNAAMQWFNAVPATDARRGPFFDEAVRTIAYHPQAGDQFAAMNATERAAARRVIEAMGLPQPRRAELMQALTAR